MTSHAIRHVRVTPIAFRDPPLLNAAGIHEPWALRSIIEIETDSGLVGINESYGDLPMLEAMAKAAPALTGLSPWALNEMEVRVAALVTPKATASEFLGTQVSLAPGTHVSKTVAKVVSAFEVAMMDLQGQLAQAPVVDLLGGAARAAVPFSAYLFYKHAEHIDRPYATDPWGEALTPEQLVAQARRMIGEHGFQSIKLKAGALPPEQEAEGILALARAFPGAPLRIDPNGNWTVATSLRATQRLSTMCQTFGLGLSMHSNSHLGISLVAMTHLAASVPLLSYACDTHYPWQDDEVVTGGRLRFEAGALAVPTSPGLGVTLDREALARLHDNYQHCGIRNRNDLAQMQKIDPGFTGRQPRF